MRRPDHEDQSVLETDRSFCEQMAGSHAPQETGLEHGEDRRSEKEEPEPESAGGLNRA